MLEVKIAGGADPVPDPAALAGMIETAGKDVAAAARDVGDVMSGGADIDKEGVEEKLKPAKVSIEKVAGYMKKHQARPQLGPRATVGLKASGADGGGVSAMLTLTITF